MSESKREAAHTPGPWFVGAQNDALYILDRRPAHDNDYPDHEADVGCIAKVYDDIRDAEIGRANAALIARAPDLAAEVERLRERIAASDSVGLRQEQILIKMEEALAAERRKVEALRSASVDSRGWLVEWRYHGSVQWLYLWSVAGGGFSFTAEGPLWAAG